MVAFVVAGSDSQNTRFSLSKRFPRHAVLSIVLIGLSIWTIHVNWPLRAIHLDSLEESDQATKRFAGYSDAQYAYGMRAWNDLQPKKAAHFFRRAVSLNVLFIDAWLRLAEAEASLGKTAEPKAILTFVDRMAGPCLHWKWSQMVLAAQLGMSQKCQQYANDLLTGKQLEQDTLQLLHSSLNGDTTTVLDALEPQNLAVYLEWLMRWGLAEESLAVWQAMTTVSPPDTDLALGYAHFLLSHKRIIKAWNIWQEVTGDSGITNPGFEEKISGKGFDWRPSIDKDKNWEIKRTFSESVEGGHALRIKFSGKANIAFYHLSQILAVVPNTCYHLSYAWKATGITTDQGPFLEVLSYDKPEFHMAGKMITGTHGWQEDSIDFTVPSDCKAVVIRLRRNASMRFDSKIRGTLWLDNFQLKAAGPGPAKS